MRWLLGAAVVVLTGSLAWQPPAAGDDHIPSDLVTPEIRRSADRGLEWLAAHQNENGSWTCRIGYKLNEEYRADRENDHVCITALAGMAFLASGAVPGRGKYGDVVEKTLDFVLSSVREGDGFISRYGTRMYEHAFATMFLAEIYGMSKRQDVGEKLRGAVRCIIGSQNKEGGWRYMPTPVDADISVTVSTLQALRAARNVGISVPKTVIDAAVKYVKGCVNADGSFNYQIERGITRSTFPLTACGVVALHSAGEYYDVAVKKGLRYLELYRDSLRYGEYHFMYGHYYAVQAFYVRGGEDFEDYYKYVTRQLLPHQQEDGHWEDDVGDAYATAMACVIMQVPCDYLPVFQK